MKIPKKSFGDRIYIEWIDAYTDDGWKSVEDSLKLDDERFCYTYGFYVGKKDGFLIICHTIGKTKDNDVLGRLCIPLKWIIRAK
jgi:hypothetical protein